MWLKLTSQALGGPDTPCGRWVRVLSKEPWAPRLHCLRLSGGASCTLSSEPQCLTPSHSNGPTTASTPETDPPSLPGPGAGLPRLEGPQFPPSTSPCCSWAHSGAAPTPTPGLPLAQVGTGRSRKPRWKAQAPECSRAAQATAHLNSIQGSCSQQPQVCDVRKTAPVGPARRTTRWLSEPTWAADLTPHKHVHPCPPRP